MRQTLGMIISVSLLAVGCASLRQETRMYHGPFGRTEVGGIVVAADPGASKVLLETYDGDLWIYDVDPAIRGRLSSLRVGDEVILAFDDRIAGKRAMALNVVAIGTRVLPPTLSVAAMLPRGVMFGAPATSPSGGIGATSVAYGTAGSTVFAPGGIAYGGGVIVPGFVGFSQLPAGMVGPQTAVSLGLGPSAFISGPTGVTTLATSGGPFLPGREPITSSNFSPGTVSPGVTTANPSAPGQPVVQGPFTPGTVAPGVSVQQGNAPPPPAGATTGVANSGIMMTPNSNRPGSDATNTTGTTTQPGTTAPPGTTGMPGTTVTPGRTGGTGTTSGPTSAPPANPAPPPRPNN